METSAAFHGTCDTCREYRSLDRDGGTCLHCGWARTAKPTAMTIPTRDGNGARILAYPSPVPGLVIHRPTTAVRGNTREWIVTHAATGYALHSNAWPSRRIAAYAATLVADLCDWSLTDPDALRATAKPGDTPAERWRALRSAVDLGDIRA